MTPNFVAIAGLSMVVVFLIAVLAYALLRFASAARKAKRHLQENTTESAFVTAALHEALTKLKAQEREMSDRAVASEQLSAQIVESLTAGLLVVGSVVWAFWLDPDASVVEQYRLPTTADVAAG